MDPEHDRHEGSQVDAEKAARDRLLRALTRASAAVAFLRGPELIYEFANDLFCRVARIDLNPIGKPFGLSPREDDRMRARAILERVYATAEPFTAREFRIRLHEDPAAPDSYFNVTFEPTRDASGAVDGVLVHGVDVTEVVVARKQVEAQREELRASEERLRSLVEAAPVALIAVDTDFRVTAAIGRGFELAGASAKDLVGVRIDVLYPQHLNLVQRALAGEDVTAVITQRGRELEVRVHPRRDASGAIIGTIGVTMDVTDRVRVEREHQKLQAQLLQVQKLESLGVLAGGIAHDFNNLLTAVLGSTSTASLVLPPESPAQAPLRDAVLAARRAADLTRQLLAYSGKGQFDVRPIDLSALVREIARLLEASIPKNVHLRLELEEGLPAIEADVVQIQQVVMNLVINGAEALGELNGTVLVTTAVHEVDEAHAGLVAAEDLPAGRYVYLEVHDTGAGMDEQTRNKIFDPFFTTKFTGRGLGLAAVLGIVRAHRGAITVHSTVGSGTTFKVFFPASALQVRPQRDSKIDAFRGAGRVLVVDDDAPVRSAVRRLLEYLGFEVVEAASGKEAVAIFEGPTELRLVILDMTMPEMSGEQTFRELHKLRQDVPVILSSGYDEVEATQRFLSKGLAGFLQKPFTPKELARCLAAALGESGDD